jgi:hypothetical protein
MRRLFLLCIMLLSPIVALSQGCTQCKDNAASTPPQTQAAYRHAITLLIIAAGSVFAGTVVLLKRSR